MIRFKQILTLSIVLSILGLLNACATTSAKTVQLSQITQDQAVNLQKSHVQFVQRFYQKLRQDVIVFLETKWTPLFLSKAVNNKGFKKDLDEAYLLSDMKSADIQVTWKGDSLVEPRKSAVLSSIERLAKENQGRLGKVLLDFASAAQTQINNKQKELLTPINDQERLVLSEINAAWADLLAGQAAVTAHLGSLVEVKKSQDEILGKLGVLEKRDHILGTLLQYSDTFTNLLEEQKNAEDIITEYKNKLKDLKEELKRD
ncbi:MAG: hypothetical protein ABIJ59_02185 [Pseudomonadota bacterium]